MIVNGKNLTKKDPEFWSEIGRMGGSKTKERKLAENPNYYADIGDKGGNTVLRTRGRDFYSQIGKMGSKLSDERRDEIRKRIESGQGNHVIANEMGISVKTARSWRTKIRREAA